MSCKKGIPFWFALLSCAPGSYTCFGQSGSEIASYRSALGTIPTAQGWTLQSQCLRPDCPDPAEPIFESACFWQGHQDRDDDDISDNDCSFGVGCRAEDFTQHYNSPPHPLNGPATCTRTEWVVLDDADNSGNRLIIADSSIPHSPPWGAPHFAGAPLGHFPLRISTGDGNTNVVPLTLPRTEGNDRNVGRIRFSCSLADQWPLVEQAVTVVARIAAGPLTRDMEVLEIRLPAYRFGFSINGVAGSTDLGRIGYKSWIGFVDYMFGDSRVPVAWPGTPGPHMGGFFTLRVICRNDGTFTAYLDECLDSAWFGTVIGVTSNPPEVAFGTTRLDDGCLWVDYIEVLEGAVPPALCPQLIFDVNRDGRVDLADFDASGRGFIKCAAGPGVSLEMQNLPAVCSCLDANGDGSVDMNDFGSFQRCLTSASYAVGDECRR